MPIVAPGCARADDARADDCAVAYAQLAVLQREARDLREAVARRCHERKRLVFEYEYAALRFRAALARLAVSHRKAGFDPNQPRDERGRWTDSGGGAADVHSPSSPLGPRPKVPVERPPTAQLRNKVIKEVARFLARAALRQALGPAGTVLTVVDAGYWLYEHYPLIKAYLDEPKPLDELRRAVSTNEPGYDNHHIVEKTPAEQDGYGRSLTNAPENIVRIPRLKHWEITGWYQTKNENYGGLSPREFLRGKDWDTRVRIGKDALVKFRVIKP